MKTNLDSRLILTVSFMLLLAGFILPFMMLMQVMHSTFSLNFVAYLAMSLGNLLGFVGIATMTTRRSRP